MHEKHSNDDEGTAQDMCCVQEVPDTKKQSVLGIQSGKTTQSLQNKNDK